MRKESDRSIVIGHFGQGFTQEYLERLAKIWMGLRTRDVFGGMGWRRLARTLSHRETLVSSSSLRSLLERHLPPSHMDLTIPTTVVAADVLTGEAVLLSLGELRRNVLASAAIPGIFPPVAVGHHLLADGGLVAHVPLLPAMQSGARTLLVCDAGYPCALPALPRGVLGYSLHLIRLMLRHQSFGGLSKCLRLSRRIVRHWARHIWAPPFSRWALRISPLISPSQGG